MMDFTTAPDGMRIELAPTTHGAAVRVTFPARSGLDKRFCIKLGGGGGDGYDVVGRDPVQVDARTNRHSGGVGAGFEHSLRVEAVSGGATFEGHGHDCFCFGYPREATTVEIHMATSFLGKEQAITNFRKELLRGEGDHATGATPRSFSDVRLESEDEWNALLSRAKVTPSTKDGPTPAAAARDVTIFYTGLYRALTFPRRLDEPGANGPVHWSPYGGRRGPAPGTLVTDNGFWDTFRTVYPLLALLYPDHLAWIVEGWLTAFKEGGWIPKWASPGYRNSMVGTYAAAERERVLALLFGLKRTTLIFSGALAATPRPRRVDIQRSIRGDAAARRWIFSGALAATRRRGHDVDIQWSARGHAAATTWTFSGALSRPRRGYSVERSRGHDVDIQWSIRGAAGPTPQKRSKTVLAKRGRRRYGDVVIAEAVVKGVLPDSEKQTAWAALKKDAYDEAPPGGSVGKVGLGHYDRYGYIPNDVGVSDCVSRTIDFAHADWATANAAEALGQSQDAAKLRRRATGAVEHLFDSSTGLMRPKSRDGRFVARFPTTRWGDGYTEGSAWHHSFPPFDVELLARLHGGKDKLRAKILQMVAEPSTFESGGYGQTIHEMREMRALAMGQYGHNNQPCHHVLWLLALAGYPDDANRLIREVIDRGCFSPRGYVV